MPELRRDPVFGCWTIISTERSRRPMEFVDKKVIREKSCPFCEGRESETTNEIYAIRKPGTQANGPGWFVRSIQSKNPILDSQTQLERFGQGMYDLMGGAGQHEIIIEHPEHKHELDEMKLEEIVRVLTLYTERLKDLEKDPRYKYALLFKNHGLVSGSEQDVIRHSRSQIIALPVTPKRVKEELVSAKNYFERKERCVFCDILRQETKDALRIVSENEAFIAICPYASRSPFEIWILPKKHSADFVHMTPAELPLFANILKDCLMRIKSLLNDPAYNMILHTAPYRHKRHQNYWRTIDEDYHWYWQITPRLTRPAGFEWGTGIYINPTPPEDAAQLLREVQYAAVS